MNLRKYAKIFGIVLAVLGILGFIPGFTSNDHLLGIFFVNGFLNLFHLVTGIIGFVVGSAGTRPSRFFFQITGVVYGVLAFVGLGFGFGFILGFIANDMADSILHLVLALISLYLGFLFKQAKE